jgi:hypothetical protein
MNRIHTFFKFQNEKEPYILSSHMPSYLGQDFFIITKLICLFVSCLIFIVRLIIIHCRSEWPRGLWRGSVASRLLGLWFRIPPWEWISASSECCFLSRRVLCVELISRSEESYRVWCVWVWSWIFNNLEALATRDCCAVVKKYYSLVAWIRFQD